MSRAARQPLLSEWPADKRLPVLDTTIGSLLRKAALAAPQSVALVDGSATGSRRRWTYAQLLEAAEQLGTGLLARFAPGERIALWAPNSPEWVVFEYGAALAGITLVTVNPAFKTKELEFVLRQSNAAGICYVEEHRGNPMQRWLDEVRPGLADLREVLPLIGWETWAPPTTEDLPHSSPAFPSVTADDVAMIVYTSGTTGVPKGAMLHHRGITNNMRFHAIRLKMGGGDVFVSPIPLFHVGGACMAALTALAAGAALVLLDTFNPDLTLELIETERATAMIGVPTMFIDVLSRLEASGRDVSSMRLIMIGGAPSSPDLIRQLEYSFAASVRNSYGQTESASIICATEEGDSPEDVAETVGRAFPQVELKIVDRRGATVARGGPGELWARGYQVMAGYFRLEAQTAEAVDGDGWLHTGDVCTMDERGYVRVVGRVKEMIIRGGENLFPKEIEEAVRAHPGVLDVAVVGVPDARLGEVVAAFVRTAPGAAVNGHELTASLRSLLSREKVPEHWRFVESFPLTASGKVQKHELRKMFVEESRVRSHTGKAGNP